MKGFVILVGFLAVVWGQETTNIANCIYQSNASTLPLNAYVKGCISPPCLIPQLDYMSIEVFFKSPRLIRSMVTEAHAYIMGPIGINYGLGDEAVTCNFITNTYCPLMESEIVRYELAMYIESWMVAGTSVTIEFVIRDQSDNSAIMCIRVPIRVVGPVNAPVPHQLNNPAVSIAQQNSTLQVNVVNA